MLHGPGASASVILPRNQNQNRTGSIAVAGDSDRERRFLIALRGVAVLINPLSSEAQALGLTESDIRTDAELRLRMAGIPVLTETVLSEAAGHPALSLDLWVPKENQKVFSFTVSLIQTVRLDRISDIVLTCATWSVTGLGMAPSDQFRDYARSGLKDYVDKFINAYLAVNPK